MPGIEWYLTESARKHVAIVEAVDRVAAQWNDRELFFKLKEKIVEMYGDNHL